MKYKSQNAALIVFAILFVIVSLFFAFIGFDEFYTVGIKKEIGAYPFGQINEVPWYYSSASTYANYNLVSGILFLITSITLTTGLLTKNTKLTLISIAVSLVFILFTFISGGIQ